MLGEITDKTNQARAFSLFGLTWSVGGIGIVSFLCSSITLQKEKSTMNKIE
jgi:hypothetical protein